MFGALELTPGQPFEFSAGENFPSDEYFTGVIGSTVAQQTGLRVGDTFQPTHGVPAEGDDHAHEEKFRVTGILERTGTPIDRALYVNLEGFFLIPDHAGDSEAIQSSLGGKSKTEDHEHEHAPGETSADHTDHEHDKTGDDAKHDHDHEDEHEKEHAHNSAAHDHEHDHDHGHNHDHGDHHHPLPEERREVTAILVLTKSIAGLPPEAAAQQIVTPINKGVVAQAVQPIGVITQFLATFLNPLRAILLGLTVLIVVVSGIGILVSIYNSMAERRHEIAVMRALGAGRTTVMRIMLLESVLLALVGGLAGWLLCHVVLSVLTPWLTDWTGVAFTAFHFTGAELLLIPGIIALASLVGFLPAWSAYRTDVAKALTANP